MPAHCPFRAPFLELTRYPKIVDDVRRAYRFGGTLTRSRFIKLERATSRPLEQGARVGEAEERPLHRGPGAGLFHVRGHGAQHAQRRARRLARTSDVGVGTETQSHEEADEDSGSGDEHSRAQTGCCGDAELLAGKAVSP